MAERLSEADAATGAATGLKPPLSMLAELTHRCPLQCPYCSNPVELVRRSDELDTAQWADVFAQAAALGVLQVHLSGGEPTARKDLPELVEAARKAGLYTNLITAGVMLTRDSLAALKARGLDHVQLSVQGAEAASAERIGNFKGGHARKLAVAAWVRELDMPLTLNAVVHRQNLDQLEEIIALACALGAHRLEVASVQYYGWALRNRQALMPTRAQVERGTETVRQARERLKGTLVIDYVVPDYYARRPKRCMDGWGNRFLAVTPSGNVLPCHAAETITSLTFSSVRDRRLAWIWAEDPAFNAFRGTDWMPEPCRSCEHKERDLGGCRCQAFAFTGDPTSTDPVCEFSPMHDSLVGIAESDAGADEVAFIYRR